MDLSLLDNPQVMVLPGPCPSCGKRVDLLHHKFVIHLKRGGTAEQFFNLEMYDIRRICCRTAMNKPEIIQLGAAYYNKEVIQARREIDVSPISNSTPDISGSIMNARAAARTFTTGVKSVPSARFAAAAGTSTERGPRLGGPSSMAREPIRPRGYAPPILELALPPSMPGMTLTNPSAVALAPPPSPIQSVPAASQMYRPPPARPFGGTSFGGVSVPTRGFVRAPSSPMELMRQAEQATGTSLVVPPLQTRNLGVILSPGDSVGEGKWRPSSLMPGRADMVTTSVDNLTDKLDEMDLEPSEDYPMGRRMSLLQASATPGALQPGIGYPVNQDKEMMDYHIAPPPMKSSRVGTPVIRGYRTVGHGTDGEPLIVPIVSSFQFAV